MFQLHHLRLPVGLLGVVERYALRLQVGDGDVVAPRRRVTAAAQEHVVGRRRRALRFQFAFPPLFWHLRHLNWIRRDAGRVPVVVGVVLLQLRREHAELAERDEVVGLVALAALARAVHHLEHLRLRREQGDVVEQRLDLVVLDSRLGAEPRVPRLVQLARRVPVQDHVAAAGRHAAAADASAAAVVHSTTHDVLKRLISRSSVRRSSLQLFIFYANCKFFYKKPTHHIVAKILFCRRFYITASLQTPQKVNVSTFLLLSLSRIVSSISNSNRWKPIQTSRLDRCTCVRSKYEIRLPAES